ESVLGDRVVQRGSVHALVRGITNVAIVLGEDGACTIGVAEARVRRGDGEVRPILHWQTLERYPSENRIHALQTTRRLAEGGDLHAGGDSGIRDGIRRRAQRDIL